MDSSGAPCASCSNLKSMNFHSVKVICPLLRILEGLSISTMWEIQLGPQSPKHRRTKSKKTWKLLCQSSQRGRKRLLMPLTLTHLWRSTIKQTLWQHTVASFMPFSSLLTSQWPGWGFRHTAEHLTRSVESFSWYELQSLPFSWRVLQQRFVQTTALWTAGCTTQFVGLTGDATIWAIKRKEIGEPPQLEWGDFLLLPTASLECVILSHRGRFAKLYNFWSDAFGLGI